MREVPVVRDDVHRRMRCLVAGVVAFVVTVAWSGGFAQSAFVPFQPNLYPHRVEYFVTTGAWHRHLPPLVVRHCGACTEVHTLTRLTMPPGGAAHVSLRVELQQPIERRPAQHA